MENLALITLVANGIVVALIIWILRKWTSDARDKAVEVSNTVKTDLEHTKTEIMTALEKEVARAHAENLAIIQMLDKKLDTTLFEARQELNKRDHENFDKQIERFEKCILELKQSINKIKSNITGGI